MRRTITLSIIIPGYKDQYHEPTVADVLRNSQLGDQVEVISVFDGFVPDWPVVSDPRRRIIHLARNRGMREAINAGVAESRGEFIMRLDEHCCVANGFDEVLVADCGPNEICTAKRFFLDPEKWQVMHLPPLEHEKLVIQNMPNGRKFASAPWRSRDVIQDRVPFSETLAMQGSMWLMRRDWWDRTIERLQTQGYGPLVQDSVEMCMKTWQRGGRLMLNKQTWYAHKHRQFKRTHRHGTAENPANEDAGYAYSLALWEDYYRTVLQPKWES